LSYPAQAPGCSPSVGTRVTHHGRRTGEVLSGQADVPCGYEELGRASWVVDTEVTQPVSNCPAADDPQDGPSGVDSLAGGLTAVDLGPQRVAGLAGLLDFQGVGRLGEVVIVDRRPTAQTLVDGSTGLAERK
jgi:hypothetical protein